MSAAQDRQAPQSEGGGTSSGPGDSPPQRDEGTGSFMRPGLLLALLAILGVGLLTGVQELTRERIAEQERKAFLAQLGQVLDRGSFDNDPRADSRLVTAPDLLGHDRPLRVYRARRNGTVVAVVMEALAIDGYNGDIHLLLAVDRAGKVLGARVLRHRETPGLGDPIEVRRSDWIINFNDRSLGDPPVERWTVRSDGGDFDSFTGATITPRAVTRALGRSLALFEARRDDWLTSEPWEEPTDEQ